jgi:hypothetical protein
MPPATHLGLKNLLLMKLLLRSIEALSGTPKLVMELGHLPLLVVCINARRWFG